MIFRIDPDTARAIDEEALTLVRALAVEPQQPRDSAGSFHPNYLMHIASIAPREIPNGKVQPTIGTDGFEVGRFFPDLNPPVGFFEEEHEKFINLCRRIHGAGALVSFVSETFVVERSFEWFRAHNLKESDSSLSEFVLDCCNRDVINQEVWLPLIGILVDPNLELGPIMFRRITQADWKRWVSDWQTRQPTDIPRLRRFLANIDTEILTVAICRTNAEPIKAFEIAVEETERVLDVLRYYCPSNRYPSMPAYCAIAGTEPVDRLKYLMVQDKVLISAGATISNLRARHPWLIDDAMLKKMRGVGFDILAVLLKTSSEDRTELQNDFLTALSIYSKSCLAQNLTDKLLYAVFTQERLLLKDNSESLQKHIGERMAFMIGESLPARIDIISNYKKAYKLRSSAVHHGRQVTPEEMEVLNRFMPDTWFTLNWIVEAFARFKSRHEMIEFIDDIKFF